VIVDDENPLLTHTALIGSSAPADKRDVETARPETFRSWLWGQLALVGVLGLATVLLAVTGRLDGYALPDGRMALDTGVAVVATIVAILAAVRFLVEGRAMDILLAAGFFAVGAGSFAFRVVSTIDGRTLEPVEAWAAIGAELFGAALIAAAPFVVRRVSGRRRALGVSAGITVVVLAGIWLDARMLGLDLEVGAADGNRSIAVVLAYGVLAVLSLVAVIGFGLRFRRHGRDLDSWLALALTLVVFADLHYVLAPARSSDYVLQGDFLRLLSFGVLLVGVWRAIGQAEFGRAVAEERARVAREIHDGLAQYLFALSTQVSMLESGAPLDEILPQLKNATNAAQQEARFAVLALSSASGTAPFDAALKRYVDFLAADGALDVEVEIDPAVTLAPDEQIEIFRIVQEGLANARRHAGARRAEVTIEQRAGRRVVGVRDDGIGFDGEESSAGQGLRNMRARAASIQGGFALRSTPGRGTAIEVVLRSV
jgi:signal transduction histidine kinase